MTHWMSKKKSIPDAPSATEKLLEGEWLWSYDLGKTYDVNIWLRHDDNVGKYCSFCKKDLKVEDNACTPISAAYKVDKCLWRLDDASAQLKVIINKESSLMTGIDHDKMIHYMSKVEKPACDPATDKENCPKCTGHHCPEPVECKATEEKYTNKDGKEDCRKVC